MHLKKKRFHLQKTGYVRGLLVNDKVVVELGRKGLLVDCLLWKNPLDMTKISLTERTQALLSTRKLQV